MTRKTILFALCFVALHVPATAGDTAERVFRYMKAIPTGGACLACHGKTLPEEVRTELDVLYPGDQARGFGVEDLRGAFTIKQGG